MALICFILVTELPEPVRKKTTHSQRIAAPNKVKPKKVPWTEEQKATVMRHLGKYITMQKLPGKEEIQAVITTEKCLQKRTWRNVKDCAKRYHF